MLIDFSPAQSRAHAPNDGLRTLEFRYQDSVRSLGWSPFDPAPQPP
ncbi:hypothetical protein RISK_004869 [Rhodopirellula islandica]|uniref:Uncharacterized protein n=1 Tax=Rhodopirellula islandica TaxID=595434 RepID=A0A0J1B992_RHOIS|nr:hypothetical protein RISK_004869 [Rhodopirellula islandica]